jgi:hypothetical protein
MSEVKGTLLGIVLALSVFAIVFAMIRIAVRQSSNIVSGRMKDSVEYAPEEEDLQFSSQDYSLTY